MKNIIVTQYQMKRAERKKWFIATLVILMAFSALIGTFLCDTLRDFLKSVNLDGFRDEQSYDSV